jgi:thioredoxin reductase (NADPH)
MTLQLETRPRAEAVIITEEKGFDLIIIGGGPAGLSAALYALRARLNTLLIEKMVLGGKASTAFLIENYPGFPEGISGMDLTQKMAEQTKKLGLPIIWGNALLLKHDKNIITVQADGKSYSARAVIIATGTETRKLGVPGEEKFTGRGVSYCATCDGAFYQNKNIMVVGGGNAAIEEALFLTRYAGKVSIVHRRDALRADKILAEKALNHPKIYFFWHSSVEEIKGESFVSAVVIKDLLSGKKLNVPVEGIFVYVGSRPNSDLVKSSVKLDREGYIITDDSMQTSLPGVFAAGDVRSKTLRQVITAAADGAAAAAAAREWLDKPK